MIRSILGQDCSFCRSRVIGTLVLAMLAQTVLLIPRAEAQITEDLEKLDDIEQPLLVFNMAGVDRAMDDMRYVFESVDRSDMIDLIETAMERVGDLDGMDRSKPFGVMLFLQPGFPPVPTPVGYLPIDNLENLSDIFGFARLTLRKTPGEENQYELAGPNRSFAVLLKDGYALITGASSTFNRKFPNPEDAARLLTSRFDLGLRINLGSIPEAIRTVFMGFLSNSAGAEMQQRDGEPDGVYLLRKANAESTLAMMEQLLTQCDDILIGFDASRENRQLIFDFEMRATPDSKFASYLKQVSGRPSYFTAVFDEQSPFTLSVSWNMDEREKKTFQALLALGRETAQKELSEEGLEDPDVTSLFDSLDAIAENGHMDLFTQLVATGSSQFTLVGGMRIAKAESMDSALRGLLARVADRPELRAVEMDAVTHEGIKLHRIQASEMSRGVARVYGEDAGLYVGTGQNTLWFSVGVDRSLDALRDTIDLVAESLDLDADRSGAPPFQLISNIASWFALQNSDENPGRGGELAREAFSGDNDQIRLEIRPIENGSRFRIRMEEGFIRMMGLGMSNRYDRSQL